jgi:hypothetical protein
MFQNSRFAGETSSRYSGKFTERGKRQKNEKPAQKVEILRSSQSGVSVVMSIVIPRTTRTAAVRVGLRHS